MKGNLVFQNQTVELPKDYKSLVNTDMTVGGPVIGVYQIDHIRNCTLNYVKSII